ncbi:MAG: TIGR03619 family F420-dependent LLM class oxidoreductase [Acidimicrobiia bacterium]
MGTLHFGMQLPVQAQSALMRADWELDAGPADVAAIAQAADRAGFHYVSVCDHIAVPRETVDRMTTVWWDTVATLAWLGAQTENVNLASTVLVLPYRHPLATAKAFSTLDYLTNGRAILGIGAGHSEGEFKALGVPFNKRGKLTDEAIVEVRAMFNDEWAAGTVGQKPRPVQPGGPPIWVGGSSPAALRRAATLGDGWLPQGPPAQGMADGIADVKRMRAEAGLDPDNFAMGGGISAYLGTPTFDLPPHFVTGSADQIAEQLEANATLGVTHPQVRLGARDCAELLDQLAQFGEQIVTRFA